MEIAIERSLKQYASLKSYFLSENDSAARFQRLKKAFSDPMTEIYLLFLQSVLPTLNYANKFLQREEPLIHCLQPQLFSLMKKLLSRFVKPSVLVLNTKDVDGLFSIQYNDAVNLVNNKDLVIGFITKQKIRNLRDNGDISEHQYSSFFKAAVGFFQSATSYLLKWIPLREDLLINAIWIDFMQRLECTFSSVEYFLHRYPYIFTDCDMDRVNEEFLTYQTMVPEDIPENIRESIGLSSDEYRADVFWGYLKTIKKPGSYKHTRI